MVWYLVSSLPYPFLLIPPLLPSCNFFCIFVLSMLFLVLIWYLISSFSASSTSPTSSTSFSYPISSLYSVLINIGISFVVFTSSSIFYSSSFTYASDKWSLCNFKFLKIHGTRHWILESSILLTPKRPQTVSLCVCQLQKYWQKYSCVSLCYSNERRIWWPTQVAIRSWYCCWAM